MQDQDMHDQNKQDRHLSRRIPISIIAGVSAVVLVAGSATGWWTWNSITAKNQATRVAPSPSATTVEPSAAEPSKPEAIQPSPQASVKTPVEQTVQVYWVKDTGTQLELTPAAVAVNGSEPGDTLKAAFEELLKGTADEAIASAIPQDTNLLSLEVRDDGVHVDLSKEFTSGGGSASMSGRLAQVIYTATTLDPNAKVWISVDGEPLEVLGGEGLLVSQPMTRAEFDENFAL